MRAVLFLLCVLSGLLSFCGGSWSYNTPNGEKVSAIITNLTTGYDKRVRPNYGGIPVTVGVSLYLLSISELSEKNMDFTFDMYFRQFWHDPRLAFDRNIDLKLVLGGEFMKNIWVPDTFFVNEKESHYHRTTVDNHFLRIMYTGNILKSIRITVKASCPLDLQYFPMDSHLCPLEIESFGYTMSDVKFRWEDGENSVLMSPDVSLPEFKVLGHRQKLVEASLSSGNYSRLLVGVMFERAVGPYVIQVYLPISLMVMISWLSLWLSAKELSARVGLCMVSILAVVIIMVSIHYFLPRISYFTAMDVYFFVCFLAIFTILVESVFVSFMTSWMEEMEKNEGEKMTIGRKVLCGFNPKYLDWISRVALPLAFLLFNIVYWSSYSNITKESVANMPDIVYLNQNFE